MILLSIVLFTLNPQHYIDYTFKNIKYNHEKLTHLNVWCFRSFVETTLGDYGVFSSKVHSS